MGNKKNTKVIASEIENEMAELTNAKVEESAVEVASEPAEEIAERERLKAEKEEKKKAYIASVETKLRAFPRNATIKELIAFRMYGIETWLPAQRKPSHTANKALEIITSALNDIPCGVISLGLNTDNNTLCTINGSSRIDDFIGWYTGKIGKKDAGYKVLPEELAKKFLKFELTIDWHVGTEKELIRDFKNLNNDVPLTGGQKAVTNLVGSNAMEIVSALNTHTIFNGLFSARTLQKQEQNNCIFLILANITDCYNAKIDKVTESLASKDLSDIDVAKLLYIFDKIESADVDLTKYKLIHMTHLMYVGDCWKSKGLHKSFDVDDMDATAIGIASTVDYKTSGTNSSDANIDRIAKMAKKLYLHFGNTANATPQIKPLEETLNPSDL